MTTTTPYTVTLNDDQSQAEIVFPHFGYSAYSGTGLANPWSITRCMEAGRVLSMAHGFSHGQELIIRGGMFVVMRCDYHIHWEVFTNVNRFHYFPFKVTVRLERVGNTSLTWKHEMKNMLDNSIMATLTAQVVHLNRKLRRSDPFPVWFVDKFRHLQKDETGLRTVVVPRPSQAPASFCSTLTIMPSSLDFNGHVNNSEFTRFALDCVAVASLRDHFRNVKGDVRSKWLQDLYVHYHKEAFLGDVIRVVCWEGTEPGQVYCVLKRADTTIASLSMNFVQSRTARL